MTSAVVLGGGRASRLDGVDKASVEVGERMLVDHVLAAVAGCDPVVAVGPLSLARPGVVVVREDPPFGGPVAAVAAALAVLPGGTEDDDTEAWLLACDLPRAAQIVATLADVPIPPDADAVVLVDERGREQWLAGRYRVRALRRAVAGLPEVAGVSVRRLVADLRLRTVVDRTGASLDLDTWADVERYRAVADDADALGGPAGRPPERASDRPADRPTIRPSIHPTDERAPR